jgi:hypothetical protein
MLTVMFFVPGVVGENVIVKYSQDELIGFERFRDVEVTEKSALPVICTNGVPVKFKEVVPPGLHTEYSRSCDEDMGTFPQSVPSVTEGFRSSLRIDSPIYLISILGLGVMPFPVIAKVYGFSSVSLLAILTVAFLVPIVVGANLTLNPVHV